MTRLLIAASFTYWLYVFHKWHDMTWLTVKLRPSIFFMYLFVWLSFLLLCFIFLSNGSVVPSILIKIDAEAQIDQRQLVAFMNTTLKSGVLGNYEVDPSSVQSTGTFSEETTAGHISMARKYCWPVKVLHGRIPLIINCYLVTW